MKKIFFLVALILSSGCHNINDKKQSSISVNDNKSKSVALMMKSYVENKFDGSIVSEDCKIRFNQLEMTKKDFVGLGEVHHMMFNDIKFPEGWIETNSYIGKDLKQAGGIYSDSYGQIWTNQWTTWSAVSKITGDTLSNPSNFSYRWDGDKIVEINAIFPDDAFNSEFNLFMGNEDEQIHVVEMFVNGKSKSETLEFMKYYTKIMREREPDVISWNFYESGKNKITLVERYSNESAWFNHVKNVSPNGISEKEFQKFMEFFKINNITVHGDATDDMKKAFKSFGFAVKFKPMKAGFTR